LFREFQRERKNLILQITEKMAKHTIGVKNDFERIESFLMTIYSLSFMNEVSKMA